LAAPILTAPILAKPLLAAALLAAIALLAPPGPWAANLALAAPDLRTAQAGPAERSPPDPSRPVQPRPDLAHPAEAADHPHPAGAADHPHPAQGHPVGYLPDPPFPAPPGPNTPSSLIANPSGLAFLEARRRLLSASRQDLAHGYAAQLDTVVVLGYRAARQSPDDPAIWRLLGRLAEIKALFSSDPFERSRLMGEAESHFRRSSSLELARPANLPASAQTPRASAQTPIVSDPYLADLFWVGRLQRGEATLADLERHWAGAGNLSPLQRPELWRDRLHLIRNAPGAEARIQELGQARQDFERLWAEMPVEVPWPGPSERFGPPKLKKIEVLEAWASTLAALARDWPGPETGAELFREAVGLYLRALDLPLDRHEAAALVGQMDRSGDLAPDEDSLLALWRAKDAVYEKWLAIASDDPAVWTAWGEEHLRRAARHDDPRVYRGYFEAAGRKFESAAAKSPRPALVWHEWGLLEEYQADRLAADPPDYPPLPAPAPGDPASAGPIPPPPGDPSAAGSPTPFPSPPAPAPVQAAIDTQAARDRLELARHVSSRALDRYRHAYGLEPDRPAHVQSLARMTLKSAARGPAEAFPELLEESDRLSALAVGQDPDTAGAWRLRGVDCLVAASPSSVDPAIRDRLVPEALSAFRRYLSSDNVRVDHLRQMADLVWLAAEASPAHRLASLRVLDEICARLIALQPRVSDYHFARGLAIYSILAADPDWPWDRERSGADWARDRFVRALASYREGLELLARWGFSAPDRGGEDPEAGPGPEAGSARWHFPRAILTETVSPGATLASASFQERLSAVLNRELEHLLATVKPETLPPWHKARLAAFLRRMAATGYPPPEDQMALFRLAELLLSETEAELQSGADPGGPPPGRDGYAIILAEKGLLMAEMSLVAVEDAEFLLSEAQKLWTGAEAASPGASRYALARWTAWSGDVELIRPLLRHTAEQQDRLLWPSYAEAVYEPSLARFHDQSWFIAAWFGYGH
jgi:hypothetical protein